MSVGGLAVSLPGTAKVFWEGTHRVRTPAETWTVIEPRLARYGVTRIADVTGLDTLGVPVAMAIRPAARTLSVSQGKGRTYELARVSAAMEAVELWHAENADPPVAHPGTAARDLDLPYRLASLADPGSLLTEASPLDWVAGTGLISGADVPVPASVVFYLLAAGQPWRPPGLSWSSNGLASGNSRLEACLHGLYEVVERDAVCSNGVAVRPIDPDTVTDADCADMIARMRSAGARIDLDLIGSRFQVPCFAATVWSPEFPVACQGWGAHGSPGVALSRAITEAAQSRLTAIAGSRDDLPRLYDHLRLALDPPGRPPVAAEAWPDVISDWPNDFADVGDEVRWLSARILDLCGVEPLVVDLSTDPGLAVVKAVVPGTAFDVDRVHPRV